MKIGILTQQLNNNYGGLLQNYALQQVLIKMGHNPITLDWDYPVESVQRPLWKSMLMPIRDIVNGMKKKMRPTGENGGYEPSEEERKVISRNNQTFVSKYINTTKKLLSSQELLDYSIGHQLDALVAGSDQCWRPIYTKTHLPDAFFSFASGLKIKRLAYAASFGTDVWEFTPEQETVCKALAQQFDLVTVREDSGVTLCREHLNVDATQVLDPTMLLNKEDYINIIEQEKVPKSSGSLFCYILDDTAQKQQFIQDVASKMGLNSFTVMPKYRDESITKETVKNHIQDCVYPGPASWLRGFMDAEMVICDSFHGCVFSIIFNKPFWVIGNDARGMSRFYSLLKMFNLESRLIGKETINNIDAQSPINWTSVNDLLSGYKSRSLEVLNTTLR